jgi:hypothetical protein
MYVTFFTPWGGKTVVMRAAFRVLRSALIMLDAVGLANLHGYEMVIEMLPRLYPACWHLVYNADEMARSSHSNRLRSRMRMDLRSGKPPPMTWDDRRPWDWEYGALVSDTEFWHTQVHGPALAWMASGSKGSPKTPAEMVAVDYLQGGLDAITPAIEPLKPTTSRTSRSRNRTKTRREARKKKAADDKAELAKYREQGEEQWGRQKGPQHAAEVLWLEQWKWSLLGAAAWATMLVKDPTAPQVHSARLSWPPFSIMSEREEERVKRHGGEGASSRRSRTPRRNRGEIHKSKGNSGDAEDPQQAFDPEDLLTRTRTSETLEEYMSLRTFICVHHFAGPEDPLSKALVKEAKSRGVRLRVISVEKASGSGDLLQDKPYKDHLTCTVGAHRWLPCWHPLQHIQ